MIFTKNVMLYELSGKGDRRYRGETFVQRATVERMKRFVQVWKMSRRLI